MGSPDQQSGVDLVRRALRSPCSTIAKNSGKDPSIVVEKVLSAEQSTMGYDALKDKYVDMIQEGGCKLLSLQN
jgi:chaperonin GroEL